MQWLGFDWAQGLRFVADYFEQLYAWACHLVRSGKAYVGEQSVHDIRSVEENAQLFARMRAGEFRNSERVLRAIIDMASVNLNLRAPVIYRILNAGHLRTGAAWHIYPSYGFTHGQCDVIEEVSHSLCTLEFEGLYDWFLDTLPVPSRPRQYEFARLSVTHRRARPVSWNQSSGAVASGRRPGPRGRTVTNAARRGPRP